MTSAMLNTGLFIKTIHEIFMTTNLNEIDSPSDVFATSSGYQPDPWVLRFEILDCFWICLGNAIKNLRLNWEADSIYSFTASMMLNSEGVGITRASSKPLNCNNDRYSSSVRSCPPVILSMSRSINFARAWHWQ
jgi:hypothetical protein